MTTSKKTKRSHTRNTGENYSLHLRTRKKGDPVYYCQFRLPSGKWSVARSTRKTKKGEAKTWAKNYLAKGKPVEKEKNTLRQFAGDNFFDYGNTWEMNKRIAGKKAPSPRWCMERTDLLKNHILPTLGDERLTRISEDIITTFRNDLYNGKNGRKYSGAFINKILFSLRDILKAAYKKNLIQSIPEFELAGVTEKRRGRLTKKEAEQLFSIKWTDDRAFIASLISAGTGIRLSEAQALKVDDIQPDGSIVICKSWDRRTQALKDRTKSGKERTVKLSPSHHARVIKYLYTHPYIDCNGFLLYSEKKKDVPASDTILMRPFHAALEKIGINKEERQRKGICYHSWRYYCTSILIEAGLPETLIREKIGHTEQALTQRYFRSENTDSIVYAIEDALPLKGEEDTDTTDTPTPEVLQ